MIKQHVSTRKPLSRGKALRRGLWVARAADPLPFRTGTDPAAGLKGKGERLPVGRQPPQKRGKGEVLNAELNQRSRFWL